MRLRLPFDGQYEITTHYGENGHLAIDYACPSGTKILAAHSGVLSYENTELGGRVARVTGNECYTRYCHLMAYLKANGAKVEAGDPIALSDNTGKATTGAHLHFASHWLNGTAFNPLDYMGGDMSKVALHFQQMTSWAGPVVSQYWQFPRWVKAMNPLVPDAFPGSFVLGRAWTRNDMNSRESACVNKGTAGGKEYFDGLLPYYAERRGIVTAWEGPNEQNLSDPTAGAKYRDFLDEWALQMHAVGLKVCGGSIAVGNPKLSCFDADNQVLRIIAPALARCDYWSYHGYWQRPYDPNDNWWAHRYREIVGEVRGMGITLPPLIISECGADIGGGHNDGWRVQYNNDWNAYFADIKRYSAELDKDAYVQAATFFTSGPNDDWDMFEIDQSNAIAMGQFVVGDVPVEPPHEGLPEDETSTDPVIMSEKVRWWSEESQRQYEAGNVARANDIRLSNIQLCYRLENILKAT